MYEYRYAHNYENFHSKPKCVRSKNSLIYSPWLTDFATLIVRKLDTIVFVLIEHQFLYHSTMLEADAGIGIFFGISCGFCIGWVLRGRYGSIASLKNLAEKVGIL